MKAEEAANFITSLKGPQWGAEDVSYSLGIDPSLLAGHTRSQLLSASFLQAIALTLGVPRAKWAFMASSSTAMKVRIATTRPMLNESVEAGTAHGPQHTSQHSCMTMAADTRCGA